MSNIVTSIEESSGALEFHSAVNKRTRSSAHAAYLPKYGGFETFAERAVAMLTMLLQQKLKDEISNISVHNTALRDWDPVPSESR